MADVRSGRAVVLTLLWGLAAWAPLAAQRPARYHFPSETVVIYQPAGVLEVEPAPAPVVQVDVDRQGADARRLEVIAAGDEDEGVLRIAYPGDRIGYPGLGPLSRTVFWMSGNGTFGHGFQLLRRKVTVKAPPHGTDAWTALRVGAPAGRRLVFYLGVGTAVIRDVEATVCVDSRSTTVAVDRSRGPVDVDTGAGDVTLWRIAGPVAVNTGAGEVSLRRIRGPGASVKTGTGSVTGTALYVLELEVDTGTGDIRLRDVHADVVDLESRTGSIRLELAEPVRALEIDADADVVLRLPPAQDADVEIETDGAVELALPHTVLHQDGSRVTARIGAGGVPMDIEAGSGDVRVVAPPLR